MEKMKDMKQNEIQETEMEQISGGSAPLSKFLQYQKEQKEKEQEEQTVFHDENSAWGSW